MAASPAAMKLDEMFETLIEDVNAERRARREPPLPDQPVERLRGLLTDPGTLNENLLQAVDAGNIRMLTTPNEGQGVYSFSTQTLGIGLDHLARITEDPATEYNLHFTLAHESRHALDADDIRAASQRLSDQIVEIATGPLPHDYTEVAREYLRRDMNFEINAETAGVNAHVSRAIAQHPGEPLSLHAIYLLSPQDMGPYVDLHETPQGPTATYKPGLVPTGPGGLHLDADDPGNRETMGRLFYQDKGYEWRQGLNGVLNAVNNVEARKSLDFDDGRSVPVVHDPLQSPRIDFAALGVAVPHDPVERVALGRVVDSGLPTPDQPDSPENGYFQFLQQRFPDARAEDVAHLLLKARDVGLDDPSQIAQAGTGQDGRMWLGGTNDQRVQHDPAETQSIAKTANALFEQAYERTHPAPVPDAPAPAHGVPDAEAPRRGMCAVM